MHLCYMNLFFNVLTDMFLYVEFMCRQINEYCIIETSNLFPSVSRYPRQHAIKICSKLVIVEIIRFEILSYTMDDIGWINVEYIQHIKLFLLINLIKSSYKNPLFLLHTLQYRIRDWLCVTQLETVTKHESDDGDLRTASDVAWN